jgi:hypothetical protein
VDPTPKAERKPQAGYYSHFILLSHIPILRLFLVDELQKLCLHPEIFSNDLKAEHVLRLVPTAKACKKDVFPRDESGKKLAEVKESTTLTYVQGNLMTMLPTKGPNRKTVHYVPRKLIASLLIDQVFYDSTLEENRDKYDFELTAAFLPVVLKSKMFTHFFDEFGVKSDSQLKNSSSKFHEMRKRLIPFLLRNKDFVESTLHSLQESLKPPAGKENVKPNGDGNKKRKVAPGDVDLLDQILSEEVAALSPPSPPPEPEAAFVPSIKKKKVETKEKAK